MLKSLYFKVFFIIFANNFIKKPMCFFFKKENHFYLGLIYRLGAIKTTILKTKIQILNRILKIEDRDHTTSRPRPLEEIGDQDRDYKIGLDTDLKIYAPGT